MRAPTHRKAVRPHVGGVLLLAAALLAVLAPPAQAEVRVEALELPARTVAGHAFDVRLRLHNDGDAPARVTLLGALYEPDDAPCGPATGEGFLGFTHLVQERLDLAPGERRDHPRPGERWAQRYEASWVPERAQTYEWCVFVAREGTGPAAQYEDFEARPLAVRRTNAPPVASLRFEPSLPRVAQDVRFEATAHDPDGDPLEYRWDFGRHDASGRAGARGPVATHRFYPAGEHVVTLVVDDGFEATRVSRALDVLAADAPSPTTVAADPPSLLPLPGVLSPLALAAGAVLLARWRRRAA